MSTSPEAFGTETDLRRDLGLGTATAMVRDRDWLGYFHRPRSRSRPCRLSFRGYCGVARFQALRALRDLFETEEGFERVDEVVAWCEKHEVYVSLNAHAVFGWQNTDWSSDNATGRALFWKERHYQDRYVGWWEQLAERYCGRDYVAGYDLLNEPVANAPPSGGFDKARYVPGWEALNALYRRTVAAIRAIDPDHIIFLDGLPSVDSLYLYRAR